MDRYSGYYLSHKNVSGSANHHHMHGASSEMRPPPEPAIASSPSFTGKASRPQTTANYGMNQFNYQNIDPALEDMHNEPQGLSILRNATHEMLIQSGNREYTRIYTERHELLDKVHRLETRIEILGEHQEKREKQITEMLMNMSKHSTVGNKSFAARRDEALRTAFPLAYKAEDEFPDAIESQEECPNVKFWAVGSFKPGITYPGFVGKKLQFLEDINGMPITEHRLNSICKFLSGAFKELKELMYGLLPKKGWATGADRELMTRCHLELARRFPELSYCQDGWKPRSLMVEWFPSFQRVQMPDAEIHSGTIKVEDCEEDEDEQATATSIPTKRIAEASKASRKKVKKEIKIPELPDPFEPIKHSTTFPQHPEPPTTPNNQIAPMSTISNPHPTSPGASATAASKPTTDPDPVPNQALQAAQLTWTNAIPLKPLSTSSTATVVTDGAFDADKPSLDSLKTNTTNIQPDTPKQAPATVMAPLPSILPAELVNTSKASSSTSISTSASVTPVTCNAEARPSSLKLTLKIPPTLAQQESSTNPNSPRPRPRPLAAHLAAHNMETANLAAPGPSTAEKPVDPSSSNMGKKQVARGRKPAKEYIVNPDSTAPKDLFALKFLAAPANAENRKAVNVSRAWNALPVEEKQEYFELSKRMKRQRNGGKEN